MSQAGTVSVIIGNGMDGCSSIPGRGAGFFSLPPRVHICSVEYPVVERCRRCRTGAPSTEEKRRYFQ